MAFPEGFTWGCAAASYQVEGAAYEDGKGLSVWDMLCKREGAIYEGNTGDVACDHYHRYEEDVALMKQIGLQAYRLSIAWPRVLPEGTGAVNDKGLDFYDRLVDALLAAGVQPWVTLFHWDYPHALYCKGGWLNRDSSDWFAEYTRVIVDKLSDRVAHWMTMNEPQCFIGLGHRDGIHAPGLKLDWPDITRAAHHALMAHGKSARVIRAHAKTKPLVGYAPVGNVFYPATTSDLDIHAAKEAMFAMPDTSYWNNTWWMDPVYLGTYPEDGMARYAGAATPPVEAGDMEIIHQRPDYFGVNIYNGKETRAAEGGGWEQIKRHDGFPVTHFHWPVTPPCLYWASRFYYERYGLPMVITENGLSNPDWVALDGGVHDPQRIDFLQRHLREYGRAAEDGVPLMGYFQWSIMDNFEWAEGYKHRFGLIHVDYTTLERTLKDSALWYKQVIATNGGCL